MRDEIGEEKWAGDESGVREIWRELGWKGREMGEGGKLRSGESVKVGREDSTTCYISFIISVFCRQYCVLQD